MNTGDAAGQRQGPRQARQPKPALSLTFFSWSSVEVKGATFTAAWRGLAPRRQEGYRVRRTWRPGDHSSDFHQAWPLGRSGVAPCPGASPQVPAPRLGLGLCVAEMGFVRHWCLPRRPGEEASPKKSEAAVADTGPRVIWLRLFDFHYQWLALSVPTAFLTRPCPAIPSKSSCGARAGICRRFAGASPALLRRCPPQAAVASARSPQASHAALQALVPCPRAGAGYCGWRRL